MILGKTPHFAREISALFAHRSPLITKQYIAITRNYISALQPNTQYLVISDTNYDIKHSTLIEIHTPHFNIDDISLNINTQKDLAVSIIYIEKYIQENEIKHKENHSTGEKIIYEEGNLLTSPLAIVCIQLITGRKNQIRRHLYMLNLPVLGDYKFNREEIYMNNLFLHSKSLNIHEQLSELFEFSGVVEAQHPPYFDQFIVSNRDIIK